MNGFTVAAASSALTVGLLLVVSFEWARTYRAVGTPLAPGVGLFGFVLLAENLVAL